MITQAQARERAEAWVNGDVPAFERREVRVQEFDQGFVVWAEDRDDGPTSDGGRVRLVIAREDGRTTLWPGLPADEVIRGYELEYGTGDGAVPEAPPEPAKRLDLEATSFLLSPPQWLQDAADKLGIPDHRKQTPEPAPAPSADPTAQPAAAAPSAPSSAAPWADADAASATPPPGVPAPAGSGGTPWAEAGAGPSGSSAGPGSATPPPGVPAPAGSSGTPWADTNPGPGDDPGTGAVPPPATVFAPPISGSDGPVAEPPAVRPEAKTELLPSGSALPPTRIAPALDEPSAPGTPPPGASSGQGWAGASGAPGGGPSLPPPTGPAVHATPPPGWPGPGTLPPPPAAAGPSTPPPPGVPGTGSRTPPPTPVGPDGPGSIADAETSKAVRPGGPGWPGRSGPAAQPAAPPSGPGAPGAPAAGYLPTQLVPALNAEEPPAGGPAPAGPPPAPPGPGTPPPRPAHAAATMLAGPGGPGMPGRPSGGPSTPPPPPPPPPPPVPGRPGTPAPPAPAAGAHAAPTMLAGPATPPPGGPGAPPPPHAAATMLAGPGPVGGPGAPPPPPPPPPGGGYGFPQPPQGVPTVGPGYMAVLRYRAGDGSEQQIIRRSAPGTPHPEWQILHELRGLGVPPQQVLELHTELESCDLPGGYCARMVRETWPQVRVSHTAPYGREHASRQQGVQHLLAHQGELHQVADGPARPRPQRVPLPNPNQVQRVPPIPLDGIGHELAQAFGPQGVFRFDQRAVARQGVPDIVAQTLVWAGLPVDFGPFFWAQAQPGRPVPTLAEIAAERGMQPAPDAASYLVMGNDFGRQLCVQYGTAHIMAVPLEVAPGAQSSPAQFVNTSLPEFARCLALLGRMWRLRLSLTPDQAGRWTVDFQAQLAALDPAALASPDHWWAVLLEQMWDGLL